MDFPRRNAFFSATGCIFSSGVSRLFNLCVGSGSKLASFADNQFGFEPITTSWPFTRPRVFGKSVRHLLDLRFESLAFLKNGFSIRQ